MAVSFRECIPAPSKGCQMVPKGCHIYSHGSYAGMLLIDIFYMYSL